MIIKYSCVPRCCIILGVTTQYFVTYRMLRWTNERICEEYHIVNHFHVDNMLFYDINGNNSMKMAFGSHIYRFTDIGAFLNILHSFDLWPFCDLKTHFWAWHPLLSWPAYFKLQVDTTFRALTKMPTKVIFFTNIW